MSDPLAPEALAALHAAAGGPDRPWTAAEFAGLLASPHALVLGDARAFVLGRVVLDEAEVLMLATHPLHRRQSLGRARLLAFHDEAARRGARQAWIEVAEDNAAALALYRGAGYRGSRRRRGYYARTGGAAADALILFRPLP